MPLDYTATRLMPTFLNIGRLLLVDSFGRATDGEHEIDAASGSK